MTINRTTFTSVVCTTIVVATGTALASPIALTAGYFVWLFS